VVTPHASFKIDDNPFAPYEVIGELGSRPLPVCVARQSALGAVGGQLVVAERFVGAGKAGDASGADLRREARRLTTLANPHLARVREIASRGDDLVVFGDFIDGEKIAQFWPSEGGAASLPFGPLSLEVALRVLLDVLTGAGALHGLRDTGQQPMKLTHGEISPATVLFGADGVGRLLHAVARRAAGVRPEAASVPYLAPEAHSGDAQDARADVFSVGVLLWEALAGRLLSPAGTEAAGLRVRSGELPAPSVPEKAPWAKALVPVVVRALAAAPEDRWPTAASMAGEIRKASGLKLAAASAAAAFAKCAFGEHAKARRARWEATSKALAFAPAASPPKASAAPRSLSLAPVVPSAAVPAPAPSMPVPAPVFSVPSAARSEEFSSSVLESYRPPPPPMSAAPAVVEPPRGLEELALHAPAPEAPSSEGPLPFEAPVVFDEVPSTSQGEAAPALPVFSMAEALRPRPASRRRLLIGGAAGAVAVSALAFFVVRSGRAPQPIEAPAPTVQAVAPAAVPPAIEAAPPPIPPSASTAGAPIAPALPAKASVAQAPTAPPAKVKAGPKPHVAGSAAAHTKSAPVRATGRPKPGTN
jgi:hypothetical protein